MNEQREKMKKEMNKSFNRKAYERALLESLKKANVSNNANKHHRNGDRGGR